MDDRERDARRLCAALHSWGSPPFKLWAKLRVSTLQKGGEAARLVVYFDKHSFDASELELAGEPEWAVRRASGEIERSPYAPVPPEPALRVVSRRSA